MKHILIIILSILLLSLFLTSCEKETGVLYLLKTPSGDVWKSFGDEDTQPKYNGEIKNGKPDGLGVMKVPGFGRYVGEWKDGE